MPVRSYAPVPPICAVYMQGVAHAHSEVPLADVNCHIRAFYPEGQYKLQYNIVIGF
jgi:hypothetical protein